MQPTGAIGARPRRQGFSMRVHVVLILILGLFLAGFASAQESDPPTHHDATIEHTDKAARSSPRDPAHAWFTLNRIRVAFVVGRYEEQVEGAEKMTEAAPDHPAGWLYFGNRN